MNISQLVSSTPKVSVCWPAFLPSFEDKRQQQCVYVRGLWRRKGGGHPDSNIHLRKLLLGSFALVFRNTVGGGGGRGEASCPGLECPSVKIFFGGGIGADAVMGME